MSIRPMLVGAVILGATLTAKSGAALIIGAPVVVPINNASVTVSFINAWAGHTGNLYFLGSGTATQVLVAAPDSGEPGLGQLLMSNHDSAPPVVQLIGSFDQGEVLHFAYDVIAPADAADDVFRTDVAGDQNNFSWNQINGDFQIEDLQASHPCFDADYNDIMVNIQFSAVPTPGSWALIMVGALAGMRRAPRRG